MADLEALVKRFYQPGSPQEIANIQKTLQGLQRSQQGWQLADSLLQSQDGNVRFFGALTFTIKINQDWETLDETDAAQLLTRLIEWLIQFAKAQEPALILRKLCSALVAYFLRPSGPWQQCMRHLLLSFNAGQPIPINQLDSYEFSTSSLIDTLDGAQLQPMLWFATGLVEEVNKADSASIQNYKYYERVSSSMAEVVHMLRVSIEAVRRGDHKLAELGVKCFQSWVMFVQRGWRDKSSELAMLRSLTPLAIRNLQDGETYDAIMELFTDILNHFPKFLTADDFRTLSSWLTTADAQQVVARLKKGEIDDEELSFARIMLAYGSATIEELAWRTEDPALNQLSYQFLELLQCNGYGDVEGEIYFGALEFWTTYTEYATECLIEEDSARESKETWQAWLDVTRQRLNAVVEAAWEKIHAPPQGIADSWDAEAKASWIEFRKDVHDFLQSSYALLGMDIFVRLAQLALHSINDRAWLPLEATLFCLNALSDSVADHRTVDEFLSKIFNSSLLADLANTEQIPTRTKRTVVTMISNYISFFERHAEYLPAMLTYLFASLGIGSSKLTIVAAKAISLACSSCRRSLTSEVDAFMQQYEVLLKMQGVEIITKEKIIGAIASIVQALPDEEKVAPLARMIQFAEDDASLCVMAMETSRIEDAPESGLSALKCLASIGKSLQAPDETVIDLDAENPKSTFWIHGQGASLQIKVVEIIGKIARLMSWDSDIIEAGCQILRAGFKEREPGLFVFPIQVSVDFVLSSDLGTARLDYVLDTAGVLLASRSHEGETAQMKAASDILTHLLGILGQFNGDPSLDPEVSAAAIELVDGMIPRYLSIFMSTPNIQYLLDFILRSLTVPEIMPTRSAAHFWSTFVVQRHNVSEEVSHFLRSAMDAYGPPLCQILVNKIAGEASRSELDLLVEPLKRIVFSQPSAKSWLSMALYNDNFPSQKVDDVAKRMWLSKVLTLRGAKATNAAVRDFWIQCRGPEFSYTS